MLTPEVGWIVLGILVGFILRTRGNVLPIVDKLTMWAIYALLFLLGVSLGLDDTVVTQAGTIGLKALLISSACVIGSGLGVWGLERFFLKGRFDEK